MFVHEYKMSIEYVHSYCIPCIENTMKRGREKQNININEVKPWLSGKRRNKNRGKPGERKPQRCLFACTSNLLDLKDLRQNESFNLTPKATGKVNTAP